MVAKRTEEFGFSDEGGRMEASEKMSSVAEAFEIPRSTCEHDTALQADVSVLLFIRFMGVAYHCRYKPFLLTFIYFYRF